jgi:hypothetical protein
MNPEILPEEDNKKFYNDIIKKYALDTRNPKCTTKFFEGIYLKNRTSRVNITNHFENHYATFTKWSPKDYKYETLWINKSVFRDFWTYYISSDK